MEVSLRRGPACLLHSRRTARSCVRVTPPRPCAPARRSPLPAGAPSTPPSRGGASPARSGRDDVVRRNHGPKYVTRTRQRRRRGRGTSVQSAASGARDPPRGGGGPWPAWWWASSSPVAARAAASCSNRPHRAAAPPPAAPPEPAGDDDGPSSGVATAPRPGEAPSTRTSTPTSSSSPTARPSPRSRRPSPGRSAEPLVRPPLPRPPHQGPRPLGRLLEPRSCPGRRSTTRPGTSWRRRSSGPTSAWATGPLLEDLRAEVEHKGITEPDALLEQLKGDLKARLAEGDHALTYEPGAPTSGSSSASTAWARPPPSARWPRCSRPTAAAVLAAGDTFRAAAAEQLGTWAERVDADLVRGPRAAIPAP